MPTPPPARAYVRNRYALLPLGVYLIGAWLCSRLTLDEAEHATLDEAEHAEIRRLLDAPAAYPSHTPQP